MEASLSKRKLPNLTIFFYYFFFTIFFLIVLKSLLKVCPTHTNPSSSGLGTRGIPLGSSLHMCENMLALVCLVDYQLANLLHKSTKLHNRHNRQT